MKKLKIGLAMIVPGIVLLCINAPGPINLAGFVLLLCGCVIVTYVTINDTAI